MAICERQAARLLSAPLDDLAAEDRDALRAGLATAGWITVDDAAARRAREDGVTTRPGDDRCAALRTGASKPREAFLALPRAAAPSASSTRRRERSLAGSVIEMLATHRAKLFASTAGRRARRAALSIDQLEVTPDPVLVTTEGALWGAI